MMTDKIDLKINEVIQFLNLLSADEQDRFLKKIQKSLSPKKKKKDGKKRKPLLVPSPNIPVRIVKIEKASKLDNPEYLDKFVKKHAINLDVFDECEGLFDGDPPTEELIKMITP